MTNEPTTQKPEATESIILGPSRWVPWTMPVARQGRIGERP